MNRGKPKEDGTCRQHTSVNTKKISQTGKLFSILSLNANKKLARNICRWRAKIRTKKLDSKSLLEGPSIQRSDETKSALTKMVRESLCDKLTETPKTNKILEHVSSECEPSVDNCSADNARLEISFGEYGHKEKELWPCHVKHRQLATVSSTNAVRKPEDTVESRGETRPCEKLVQNEGVKVKINPSFYRSPVQHGADRDTFPVCEKSHSTLDYEAETRNRTWNNDSFSWTAVNDSFSWSAVNDSSRVFTSGNSSQSVSASSSQSGTMPPREKELGLAESHDSSDLIRNNQVSSSKVILNKKYSDFSISFLLDQSNRPHSGNVFPKHKTPLNGKLSRPEADSDKHKQMTNLCNCDYKDNEKLSFSSSLLHNDDETISPDAHNQSDSQTATLTTENNSETKREPKTADSPEPSLEEEGFDGMEGGRRIKRRLSEEDEPNGQVMSAANTMGSPQQTVLKMARFRYLQDQINFLNAAFSRNRYPSYDDLVQWSVEINVPVRQLQIWFQNKRASTTGTRIPKTKQIIKDQPRENVAKLPVTSACHKKDISSECRVAPASYLHGYSPDVTNNISVPLPQAAVNFSQGHISVSGIHGYPANHPHPAHQNSRIFLTQPTPNLQGSTAHPAHCYFTGHQRSLAPVYHNNILPALYGHNPGLCLHQHNETYPPLISPYFPHGQAQPILGGSAAQTGQVVYLFKYPPANLTKSDGRPHSFINPSWPVHPSIVLANSVTIGGQLTVDGSSEEALTPSTPGFTLPIEAVNQWPISYHSVGDTSAIPASDRQISGEHG